jgi:hypothetical protein
VGGRRTICTLSKTDPFSTRSTSNNPGPLLSFLKQSTVVRNSLRACCSVWHQVWLGPGPNGVLTYTPCSPGASSPLPIVGAAIIEEPPDLGGIRSGGDPSERPGADHLLSFGFGAGGFVDVGGTRRTRRGGPAIISLICCSSISRSYAIACCSSLRSSR